MKQKLKEIFYGVLFIDFIITFTYLARQTDTIGKILVVIFVILLSILAVISLGKDDDNENKC